MYAEQAVGFEQRRGLARQLRRDGLLRPAIRRPVVPASRSEPQPLEHAEAVRVEWEQSSVPRRDQNLVGTGLSDHWKPRERTTCVRDREPQRRAQIAIPMADHKLGGLP